MEGGGACLFGILREVSHATSMPSNILHNLVLNVRLYTRDNLHEKKKKQALLAHFFIMKKKLKTSNIQFAFNQFGLFVVSLYRSLMVRTAENMKCRSLTK